MDKKMHKHLLSLVSVLAVLVLAGCGTDKIDEPVYTLDLEWGSRGTLPGQFIEPIGILISDGEVFVTDAGNSRIQVFSTEGKFLRTIGTSENGELGRPMHLGLIENDILVADYLLDRITRYTRAGVLVSTFGSSGTGPAEFDAPSSATVSSEGHILVADFYNQRVQELSSTGEMIREFGSPGVTGPDPGQFTYPTAVALTPEGGFVVADAYNHRVQAFDSTGEFLWKTPDDINWADTTNGRFNVATSVAVAGDGRVFVADFYNNRLQVLSSDGAWLETIDASNNGGVTLNHPTDVATDDKGGIYVVDFGNSRILKFVSSK
jgi:DNA-binding beta-propeller fold protein YncE